MKNCRIKFLKKVDGNLICQLPWPNTIDLLNDYLRKIFFQKAHEGKPLVVADIRKAYEAAIGKKVPASTVYRMLARHGWRPQSDDRSMDKD